MTIHGDLYYEGKEFETRLKEKKPGDLSEELRTALGMPVGPNAHKASRNALNHSIIEYLLSCPVFVCENFNSRPFFFFFRFPHLG